MSLDRKIDRPSAYEIIPNRLFYTALRTLPKETPTSTFFCIDSQLVYWNFFLDFGPLNLGQLYRFCSTLNSKLKSEQHKKKAIYYYSGTHGQKRANAVFLICAWKMLYMGSSAEDAFEIFKTMYPGFPPFHDASPCACTYNLSILDCLMGLQKAKQYKFFDFDNFDPDEYEYYEQVENGDLNWIAKDKFVAFAGPHNSREVSREGYRTLTPDDYIPYFKKTGVKLVVRLNKKYYDERKVSRLSYILYLIYKINTHNKIQFINAGIRHAEIYYLDGSCPPVRILKKVIESFESTDGAIAVHCKAGLGRTGTCIGCYIMKVSERSRGGSRKTRI